MEELHIINGNRVPELHTIIIWNGNEDINKIDSILKNLPVDDLQLLQGRKLILSKSQQQIICRSIYLCNENRVRNNSIYIILVKDLNPEYSFEKASSCWQVLNKKMKIVKEFMRLKLGGSKTSYLTVHTSYNPEEVLLVLKPLNLTHLITRPTFPNFKDFFEHLNKQSKLKYVILRSFHELEYSPDYFKTGDIDILVNDYFYFKSITGARSVDIRNMRENDNGYNIQSKIKIGGLEIAFDIRFVGDDYIDSNWEHSMLNTAIEKNMKNHIIINIPNTIDELYSLIYHIIIQKPNPSKSKHINRVQQLLDISSLNKLDFNNLKDIRSTLDRFMEKHNYHYKKPFDKGVGFNI
jgi:hypothetical protein